MSKRSKDLIVTPEVQIPPPWFEGREYQMKLWDFVTGGGKNAVAQWHRRAGKDLLCLLLIAHMAMRRVGTYWHIFPTFADGKKAIWNGITNDGDRYTSVFPMEIIETERGNELFYRFKNGSVYQMIGASEPDKLRGTNAIGFVYSEYAYMNKRVATVLDPVIAANNAWQVWISTPRGANHFTDLYDIASEEQEKDPKAWFAETLDVDDTLQNNGKPVIPNEAIDLERKKGKDEWKIQREYYCSRTSPVEGSYYGNQVNQAFEEGRIDDCPYDRTKEVHAAWDLGYADYTAIWFFQLDDNKVRLIDYYQATGEDFAHYAKILRERPYVYGTHIGPHDLLQHKMGSTTFQDAKRNGINFKVLPKSGRADGIEAVRSLFSRCYFDKKKTATGVKCLKAYRKKSVMTEDGDEVFTDQHVHDEASHGADAFRYLAMGMRQYSLTKREGISKMPTTASAEYSFNKSNRRNRQTTAL